MDFLIDIDTDIFLFFNGMHCAYADRFMQLFSERFIWIPMYIAMLVAVVRNYGWVKASIIVVGVVAAVAIADQTCATLIRPTVQRLRPANLDNPLSAMVHIVDGYRGGRYGFPSCHAANTFAVVGLLAPILRNPRVVGTLIAWAAMSCYSRIHLGVHYPGDLLAGAAIGFLTGLGCSLIVRIAAFGNRRPDAVNSETTDVYIALPILSAIPMLKLIAFRFRHTDFITIAIAATTVAIMSMSGFA